MQFGTQQPVGQHEPAENTQAALFRGGEQRGGRAREMRTENQRRRGAVRGERGDKLSRDGRRISRVGQARFLGQRQLFQPVEQPVSQAAEDADLRKVHVRVDESGQDVTAAQIADRGFRMGLGDGTVIAAVDHFAILNREGSIGIRRPKRSRRETDSGACERWRL